MTLALVMGGGGIAGIAWHTGVLLGLSESGADPSGADVLIGTSAGSTVGAQLGYGHSLQMLFDRQIDPATLATERTPPVTIDELLNRMAPIFSARVDAAERRRRLGAMALDTDTIDEEVRRAVIAARLVGEDWPARRLLVPVVEATTGRRRVLDRSSGVGLIDAVAASSAVPGVWPPVTLDGARYIDGGVWSLTNSDLAYGNDRVLVLAPIVDPSVDAELAGLGPTVRTLVVRPDAASLYAFGSDVLDPAVREPSARAGLAQGRAEADQVRELLAG
jgi:NTE family protein